MQLEAEMLGRWTQRTKHLGQELAAGQAQRVRERRKLIKQIEERQLASSVNAGFLKNLFHRGFWKYKKSHYKFHKPTMASIHTLHDDSSEEILTPAQEFANAVEGVLQKHDW